MQGRELVSRGQDVLQQRFEELRRVRDELRLKVHLGRMDARELWDDLEQRWNHLEPNANADAVHETIAELREGYDRLASMLREFNPENLWGRFRSRFARLVAGSQSTAEHVAGSFEELGDAAKVRVARACLERRLIRKRAELGARVYELAKEPGPPDSRPRLVLDDNKVKALLQEVGSLDADFQKAADGGR